MSSQSKQWIFERLKHSIQALACDPNEQLRLFPNFAVKTDELVLDFDNFKTAAMGNFWAEMTPKQVQQLESLSLLIDSFSQDRSIWSESALQDHKFWKELRHLATLALAEFGWSKEIPPDYKHEFIQGRNRTD